MGVYKLDGSNISMSTGLFQWSDLMVIQGNALICMTPKYWDIRSVTHCQEGKEKKLVLCYLTNLVNFTLFFKKVK